MSMNGNKRPNIFSFLMSFLAGIGALNWGLIGLNQFNMVEFLFNRWPVFVRSIYVLVGISGIYLLFACCRTSRKHNF